MTDELITKLETAESQGISTLITRFERGDFELDGLRFTFTKQEDSQGSILHVSAQVGYMPYTAESRDKRANLNRILLGARAMRRAKLALDKQGYIALKSTISLKPEANDIDAIMGLSALYQEASPILRLIAKYL
ncbi:MAG: hypothetical protein WBK91_07435 [Alphaproteobacteria bacterium]